MFDKPGPGAPALVDRLGIAQAICQNVILAYADRGKPLSDPIFAMVDKLVAIIEDETTPGVLKKDAIKILLEYMCGKPRQVIDLGDNTLDVKITKAKE